MADRANVSSVDALEEFRSALIVYVSKARPTLEEVSSEIQRVRSWLQNDQRVYWEGQMRKRLQVLDTAKAALSSARMALLKKDTTLEQMAVHKATRAVQEAEAKLKVLKQWNREFDGQVDPLSRQLDKLHTILSHDMMQAVAYLARAITTLQAYMEASPSQLEPAPPQAAPPANAEAAAGTEPAPASEGGKA
jgi:hypothetical protein